MKGSRNLWISVIFVVVLVVGSLAAFATGTKPVLGLDLEGGVSVVLHAPSGTPAAVMQQALENIRNRIDAFGVGEPQLFLSGTNIEVQIPGLARGTIETRPKDQFCLIGTQQRSFGCFGLQSEATSALSGAKVNPVVEQVCLTGVGDNPPCFGTQALADAAAEGTDGRRAEPIPVGDALGGSIGDAATAGAFGGARHAVLHPGLGAQQPLVHLQDGGRREGCARSGRYERDQPVLHPGLLGRQPRERRGRRVLRAAGR